MTRSPGLALLLTVRNASKEDPNTKLLGKLLAQHPQARASIRELDLGRLASVHEFCREVAAEISNGSLPPLVGIMCNAYYWNLTRPLSRRWVREIFSDHALGTRRLATNDAHPDERGYFKLLERSESSAESMDQQKQGALWVKSAQWVGLAAGDTTLALT